MKVARLMQVVAKVKQQQLTCGCFRYVLVMIANWLGCLPSQVDRKISNC